MIKETFTGLLFVTFSFVCAYSQQTGKWGDQGNGTYRNPILPSDYCDPDVIRVGDDYYLISSTFHLSPGMVILHSKDLVNWKTISYAVDNISKLGPNLNWDKMNRYNRGIYAGSIRYHQGVFYIHFATLDEGFFVARANNISGPWKVEYMRDKNDKPIDATWWDDPCPFWDEDGKAYMVASKLPGGWYPRLFQMSEDGTQLVDAVVDSMKVSGPRKSGEGTIIYNKHTSEGNKIYKINGFYYLFHNEVTMPENYRIGMMKRSKYLYGEKPDGTPGKPGDPGAYETRKFLRGSTGSDREPNQGGLVNTPDGKWYFITHQGRGYSPDGRPLDLLPVQWTNGWPIPGIPDKDTVGTLVWSAKKPIAGFPVSAPQGSDEFTTTTLHPQWQWNYQPRADKWSLTEKKGYLRLYAFKPLVADSFFTAGNTMAQRYFMCDSVIATVKIDVTHMADGQEAGFTHFNGGVNYSNMGIVQKNGIKSIKYDCDRKIERGAKIPASVTFVWIKSIVDKRSVNRYEYSFDGKKFIGFGGTYLLRWGNYRGDLMGIYNYNNVQDKGYIDVDWFHYHMTQK